MSEGLLEIAVLGGLRLRRDGLPLAEPGVRKATALFIYLAVMRQPHTREALADLLWDERSPAQGLQGVRQLLTSLRPTLAPYLVISRNTLAFDLAQPHWLDVTDLEAHLAAAGAGRPRGAPP